ncbi:hypothetical protein D4R75_16185 [bacterium]|nr:MAG: hypothetical protein D4R75_16185 [bacterium]
MDSPLKQTSASNSHVVLEYLLISIPHIWTKRRQIILCVGLMTVLTTVIVLLIPSQYTAETSILPDLEKNKLLGLAGASDLAAVTGLNIGEAPVSKLYPVMVKSARILSEVLYTKYKTSEFPDSVDLIRFWGIKKRNEAEKFEKALDLLRDRMEVSFDNRLGTLSLKVSMEEPGLAADVANRATSELDIYTRTKKRTSVTAQREFIEMRLKDVASALASVEDSLRSFREKNRRVADSPQLVLMQGRLERAVQINSTIFIELKKQVEIAKIEEIKNVPIINVLDPARVPVASSSPQKLADIVFAFLLSLGTSVVAVAASVNPVIREFLHQIRLSYKKLRG